MKSKPFYFEIKNLITQFMGAFNDIAIKRYDQNRRDSGESVGVGFKYAPKQRVIEDLINKSGTIPLPVISVSIASIARDQERVFNKIDGSLVKTSRTADTLRLIPQPVPVNIIINMSIIARYQADIEQIISNFVPYCDPYIAVSWKLPTTEGTSYEREIRTIIDWSGTLNMQYPVELASNQLARVTCDTTFTIKGWLFKQIDSSSKDILKIQTTHIPSMLGDECVVYNNDPAAGAMYDSEAVPEIFIITQVPKVLSATIDTYVIDTTRPNKYITVYGSNLLHTTGVFLKVIEESVFNAANTYSLFANTSLSATYSGFDGREIQDYTINSENSITFKIPDYIVREGQFDIVVVNPSGYGTLTQDSRVANIPDIYQPAFTSGIKVIV